jgi:hypothetical protein
MPVQHDHHADLKLRLKVRLSRPWLDREIADGGLHELHPALALRARQLIEPRTRRRAARNLRDIVKYVDRAGAGRIISAVVIERTAVRVGREAILGLAERLEGTAPVSPRGVARVQILLTDGRDSPFFNSHCGYTVADAIWEAAELLGAPAPFDAVVF